MYYEQRGRIFNFLNSLQESLLLELVIILITLFCSLKLWMLRGELSQKISP
jgi:hypothetical protein